LSAAGAPSIDACAKVKEASDQLRWQLPASAHPEGQDDEACIVRMETTRALQSISDDELLHRLRELMRDSRRVESDLVAHIAEVDGRRLYAREASPSMFAYCTQVLHLSEAEAYLRITAARASRRSPLLLTMLADGRLHLNARGFWSEPSTSPCVRS
jgi:hypothetical protein